jgi:hypothetical protein
MKRKRNCRVLGCCAKVYAKGYCERHYVQFRKYDLLKELPEDLVEHLQYLHQLNHL